MSALLEDLLLLSNSPIGHQDFSRNSQEGVKLFLVGHEALLATCTMRRPAALFHVIFPSHAFILNEQKEKEKAGLLTFVSV